MPASPVAVFDEQRVILFQIPKVLHSTLGIIFSKMREEGQVLRHLMLEEVSEYPDYDKYCVVRNPYDRVVSLYANKNMNGDLLDSLGYGLEAKELYSNGFQHFVEKICSVEDEAADRHFRSQHLQIVEPVNVLKFEEMSKVEEVLREIFPLFTFPMPHANSSHRKGFEEYYTPYTKELVSKRYTTDIEKFGYGY